MKNGIMKLKLATWVLALLLLADAAVSADGQKPIPTGVLKISGPHRTLANSIADLLTANLSANELFHMVDRTELDKVLGELELGQSGTVNADTAAKVGHLTGAKVLVTGREMMPNGSNDVVVIINIIGTENGRVFSQTAQGPRSNIVALVSDLSQRVSDTILKQSTNLLVNATEPEAGQPDKITGQPRGKKFPAVSIKIQEQTGGGGATQTAEAELRLIFQRAGFAVVDEKSQPQPDVIITGDAFTGKPGKRGNLISYPATISVKAQERATGRILSLDLQRTTAAGAGDEATAQQALQQAADELSQRLVPLLSR